MPPTQEKLEVMYGKDNIFLGSARWLHNLRDQGDRMHARGVEECFKGIGSTFKSSGLELVERLQMLINTTPIIDIVDDAAIGSPNSYVVRAVKDVIDNLPEEEQTNELYEMANRVLNALHYEREKYPV